MPKEEQIDTKNPPVQPADNSKDSKKKDDKPKDDKGIMLSE